MPIRQTLDGRVPVMIWTDDADPESLRQLRNVAALPFVFHHVAAMADVHAGIGATIGTVMATKGAVIPAAVGVDIGCGMAALKLPLDAGAMQGRRPELRHAIERSIPTGFESHRHAAPGARSWDGWRRFKDLHPRAQHLLDKAMAQLGTLGGGNHFIELCRDEEGRAWVMLHSGSRHVGKCLADFHISEAKAFVDRQGARPPDPALSHLEDGTRAFDAYMHDLLWAQDYARENRRIMLDLVLKDLSRLLNGGRPLTPEAEINCHHNYAARERHFGAEVIVTRKGAVRAGVGEMGVVPGSMGTKSFIVRGKGCPEAYDSCSHGAGRRMSRHEAKRRFTVADLKEATQGVECRKDGGVLDEIPQAYKPIDDVIANQSDLVEVTVTLKQVLCVKG
ncbi:MAG: RtcB family protein [Elusimicrobia bacterium]|nr:RtcB family protein [Elusimicrobiota bacterium]